MTTKRILLTSIQAFDQLLPLSFATKADESGTYDRFCSAILPAEVSIKYVLSTTPIDEVIILGDPTAARTIAENQSVCPKHLPYDEVPKAREKQTYNYLLYRIHQFLNGVDREVDEYIESFQGLPGDTLQSCTGKIYEAVSGGGKEFPREESLYRVQNSADYCKQIREMINKEGANYPLEDQISVLSRFYKEMPDRFKMRPLECNLDVPFRYYYVRHDYKAEPDNILAALREMTEENDSETNVEAIIDYQGMPINDAFSLLTIFSMLDHIFMERVVVKQLLADRFHHSNYHPASTIYDWTDEYYLNDLGNAISIFLEYGKADQISAYWETLEYHDPLIGAVIDAMRQIDAAISLCTVDDLVDGIVALKVSINRMLESYKPREDDFFGKTIVTMLPGLIMHYGPLLTEEKPSLLHLVQWCSKKKLYQQTLTLIESRLPKELMQKGLFYYARSQEELDGLLEKLYPSYLSGGPAMYYSYDHMDHYIVKNYGRSFVLYSRNSKENASIRAKFMCELVKLGRAMDAGEPYQVPSELFDEAYRDNLPELIPVFTGLSELTSLEKVFSIYFQIGPIRNKINHAVSEREEAKGKKGSFSNQDRYRQVKSMIAEFTKAYENICNEVEGKSLSIYEMPFREMRRYDKEQREKKKEEKKRSVNGDGSV